MATKKPLDQRLENLSLMAARIWAEEQMERIDPNVLLATLTRTEYHDLLVLVYAQGFRRGSELARHGA